MTSSTRAHRTCVFCEIVAGRQPAIIIREWPDALAIVPLNPVALGHLLVLPRTHVRDVAEDAEVSAQVMRAASLLAGETANCNVITSRGRAATQSVFHLHLHVVPREENDGLVLPWYSGKRRTSRSGDGASPAPVPAEQPRVSTTEESA